MTVRLSVAGAGLIGQRHLEEIDASPSADIAAIVVPFSAAAEVAEKFAVPLYSSLAESSSRTASFWRRRTSCTSPAGSSVWQPAFR
jgi:hypothetical protein